MTVTLFDRMFLTAGLSQIVRDVRIVPNVCDLPEVRLAANTPDVRLLDPQFPLLGHRSLQPLPMAPTVDRAFV
jgi:hypothetical protein